MKSISRFSVKGLRTSVNFKSDAEICNVKIQTPLKCLK
jgi:hypothetical protein